METSSIVRQKTDSTLSKAPHQSDVVVKGIGTQPTLVFMNCAERMQLCPLQAYVLPTVAILEFPLFKGTPLTGLIDILFGLSLGSGQGKVK